MSFKISSLYFPYVVRHMCIQVIVYITLHILQHAAQIAYAKHCMFIYDGSSFVSLFKSLLYQNSDMCKLFQSVSHTATTKQSTMLVNLTAVMTTSLVMPPPTLTCDKNDITVKESEST